MFLQQLWALQVWSGKWSIKRSFWSNSNSYASQNSGSESSFCVQQNCGHTIRNNTKNGMSNWTLHVRWWVRDTTYPRHLCKEKKKTIYNKCTFKYQIDSTIQFEVWEQGRGVEVSERSHKRWKGQKLSWNRCCCSVLSCSFDQNSQPLVKQEENAGTWCSS